jgi:hypothetical protein
MYQSHSSNKSRRQIARQNPKEILKECCKCQAPAIILTVREAKVYCHASLASMSGDSLTLRLKQDLVRVPITGSDCCVSFNYKNDTRAFFAEVLEYRHKMPPEHPEVVLKLRSGIVRSEARLAYRVRITLGSKLVVHLITKDGRDWKPKVIDLSLAGMFVDFSNQAICPKLRVGSEVNLDIQLPPDAIKLKGEVRRRTGPMYGIFFPAVVTNQGITPPPALKQIVGALEREWLQARLPDS